MSSFFLIFFSLALTFLVFCIIQRCMEALCWYVEGCFCITSMNSAGERYIGVYIHIYLRTGSGGKVGGRRDSISDRNLYFNNVPVLP